MAGHQHEVPEVPAGVAAPGLIIRYGVNLGEQDRILQFEGFIDRDSDPAEINHLCDKIVGAGDRLRARHMLPTYRRQLEDVEHKHNENRARLAGMEAQLKAMAETRSAKIEELRIELSDKVKRASEEHYASGRRGAYNPPRSIVQGTEAQIDQLMENQRKEEAEAEIQRAALNNELKEGERAVYQLKRMIREQEALAGESAAANDG